MAIEILDRAIETHPFHPKGIKVGSELWRQLDAAGRITWVRGFVNGIADSGVDYPTLDGKIFVHVSPDLDDLQFELPSGEPPR